MVSFRTLSSHQLFDMQDDLRDRLKGCRTLEGAAQSFAESMHERFASAGALMRVYATLPYGSLPKSNRDFVDELAAKKGIRALVRDETLVLTLLGTAGASPAWNDRRKSKAHVGIPLASKEFVDSVPMIARLLHELGMALDVPAGGPAVLTSKVLSVGWVSLFYVADAATAVDHDNRKVIPALEFVDDYGIKSVFGLGETYADGTNLAFVFFCRETVERQDAEALVPLTRVFNAATSPLVWSKTIFAEMGSVREGAIDVDR
jgi:hypothetical protein